MRSLFLCAAACLQLHLYRSPKTSKRIEVSGAERYAKNTSSTTTGVFLWVLRGGLPYGRDHAWHGFELLVQRDGVDLSKEQMLAATRRIWGQRGV